MDIRVAKVEDSSSVHRFYCDLLEENIPYIRDNPAPTLEEESNFIKAFVHGAGDLLLAFDGEEVVGMLGMQRSMHYQENHRIQIGLSVKQEFRGSGIGQLLLQNAMSWAKENAVSSIELDVVANNPAIKLYKKMGYEEVGKIKNGFKNNGRFDDIISMQNLL